MKTLVSITLIWLLAATAALAESPKALLAVSAKDISHWPAEYSVAITVPQDHHAYLDAGDKNIYIPVALDPDAQLATDGLTITHIEKPSGAYDQEVAAQVLRGQAEFTVTLTRIQTTSVPIKATAPLAVRYQLCNDMTHVCFRPQTANLELPLPSIATTSQAPDSESVNADEESSGLMHKLLKVFENNKNNTALMFGLMLLAGLLSVATPCVYPMLPITSMFILNRAGGKAEKEKLHAFVYLVGIIGTYMALGLIAGMTGGAFNTFMQSATINLAFAAFFAFFALSLLGFYELAFMQNEVHSLDQHSARVKGLTGTWLMGTVAGLVISPCVGPIVFALLLQVADTIAEEAAALAAQGDELSFWGRLSIAASGSVMMAGFGAGVGIPFFVISVVKFKKLPKAGYWMNKIKYAFGFMILYFAYTYFHKGLGVLGANDSATLALAFGMLAIWIAVVHCNALSLLPHDAPPNQKLHHFCGILSLLVGVWLAITSLEQLPLPHLIQAKTQTATAGQHIHGVNNIASSTHATEEEAGITWHRSYAAAQKLAQQTKKPIFIDFYASWCANCVAFKEEVKKNQNLNSVLRNNAIVVKLVDKEPEFEAFRDNPEHRHLKIGLPYFAILTPDGKLAWSGTDYQATQKMVSVLTDKQLFPKS